MWIFLASSSMETPFFRQDVGEPRRPSRTREDRDAPLFGRVVEGKNVLGGVVVIADADIGNAGDDRRFGEERFVEVIGADRARRDIVAFQGGHQGVVIVDVKGDGPAGTAELFRQRLHRFKTPARQCEHFHFGDWARASAARRPSRPSPPSRMTFKGFSPEIKVSRGQIQSQIQSLIIRAVLSHRVAG